jgi:CheY-like chemotaxis protein
MSPVESQTDSTSKLRGRVADLEKRVQELERLCAEVYVAGVELGLPDALLKRLWIIAAEGNLPAAFEMEKPPEMPRLTTARNPVAAGMPMPDLKQIDRAVNEASTRGEARGLAAYFKPMPRRRVAVVDDDPLMVEVLVRILRHENFELITAFSGTEALERSEGHQLDLLITDFHMPHMKGPELADRLRERLPSLKVLYQTGFSDQLFEERVVLAEGEQFLEKPFSAKGLREATRLAVYGRINP